MKFNFSIRTALRESWDIFKAHPGFFILLSVIMLVLNVASRVDNWLVSILISIGGVVWSYVWLSVALSAVDGNRDMLSVKNVSRHLPTWRQLLKLVVVGIASGIIIILGLILLIIPGIYFMTKLAFSNLALVDRQGSIKQSLRYSWYLVKKDTFWTVLLTLFVALMIVILGIILLGVGFVVAYPLAMLMVAKLYRTLTHYHAPQEVVVQPTEIPSHTETV